MAEFGFRVFGPGGKIIVDHTAPNLMAVSKGTLSLGDRDNYNLPLADLNVQNVIYRTIRIGRAQVPQTAPDEMLLFEVPEGERVYHHARNVFGSWVYSTAATLRYVKARFARYLPGTPPGSFGVQVRDKSGRITYDSNARLMVVMGTVATAPAGVWVSPETSLLVAQGESRLFAQGVLRYGGVLTAQAIAPPFTGQASGVTCSDAQRVRGLVADIDWDEV